MVQVMQMSRKLTLQAQIVATICVQTEKTTNYKVQVGKPIEQTDMMNCSRNVAIEINSARGILSARRWRPQQAKTRNQNETVS